MERNQNVEIGIVRIYVKDLSFESPLAPQLFSQNYKPEVKVNIGVHSQKVQDGLYESTIDLKIEGEQNDKAAFIIEVEHSILLEIRNASDEQREHILSVFGPSTLFPYTRQVVDQAMLNGGLPPMILAPIDFEMVRRQKANNQQHS